MDSSNSAPPPHRAVDGTPPRSWIGSVTAVVLVAVVSVLAYGYLATRPDQQRIWSGVGLTRFYWFTTVYVATSLPVLWFRPALFPAAVLTVGAALTVIGVGVVPLASALLVFASAEALGARILGTGGKSSEPDVLNLLTGLAIYVLAMGLTARIRVHYPLVYLPLFALPLLLDVARLRRNALALGRHLAGTPRTSWLERGALALPGYVLLMHWLIALKPEVSTDGLAMHLAIPANIASSNLMTLEPDRVVWSVMPMGADYAYTLAYVLGGEAASRLVNLGMLCTVAAALACTVRSWLGPPATLLLVACFGATPLVALVTGSLFVENQQAALIMGALMALWKLGETGEHRHLIVGAGLAGTAVATKLGSTSFVACMLPFIAWELGRMLGGAARRSILAGIALLVFCVFAAPPYVTAWWKTGNPVFPFQNATFRSPLFDAINFTDGRFLEPLDLRTPFSLIFHTSRWYEGQNGSLGLQALLLLPLALVAMVAQPSRRVLSATAVSVVGAAVVLSSVPNARYIYPALPLLFVPTAALLGWLLLHARAVGVSLVTVVAGCLLFNVAFFPSAGFYDKDFALPVTTSARREHIRSTVPIREVVEHFNANYQSSTSVLTLSSSIAELRADVYAAHWHQWRVLRRVQAAADIPALRELLAEWRVDLLIAPVQGPDLDAGGPVLRSLLERCTNREFQAGGYYLARLGPSCTQPVPPADGGRTQAALGISGALSLDPNPVPICRLTGLGRTTVSWTMQGTTRVEVRIGAPDGALLTLAGAPGRVETGDWVVAGTSFYLQNAAAKTLHPAANTIARATVEQTTDGPCR